MLHRALLPSMSRISGLGIVAVENIPAGTITWASCTACQVYSQQQLDRFPSSVNAWLEEFGYWSSADEITVPCRQGYLLNHSCAASVLHYRRPFGVAVRDIAAGEEVTIDYRALGFERKWCFKCACGNDRCEGEVSMPKVPSPALVENWIELIEEAMERVDVVSQDPRITRALSARAASARVLS